MANLNYNWGITGHSKQLLSFENDVASGNLAHAYLLTGPAHVGKYTLAGRLAAVLQCDAHGCGSCGTCINIAKGYHPDTIEMNDNGETIKIEPMRETLARLSTTAPGNYKIFLVQNIDRMTSEAANALLKTLEEPPSKVLFLFTSSRPENILSTILSRLRVVKFKTLNQDEIAELLQKKYPLEARDKLQKAAEFSFGLPGRAVFFMENEEAFSRVQGLFERVRQVLSEGGIAEKFALVDEVTRDEELFGEFFDIFLLALRYTMLDEAQNGASAQKLQRTIDTLLQTQKALHLQKRNVNSRLLFEHLMLQT